MSDREFGGESIIGADAEDPPATLFGDRLIGRADHRRIPISLIRDISAST